MSMPGSAKAAKDESAKSGKAATVDAKAEKVSTPKMSSKFFPTLHILCWFHVYILLIIYYLTRTLHSLDPQTYTVPDGKSSKVMKTKSSKAKSVKGEAKAEKSAPKAAMPKALVVKEPSAKAEKATDARY